MDNEQYAKIATILGEYGNDWLVKRIATEQRRQNIIKEFSRYANYSCCQFRHDDEWNTMVKVVSMLLDDMYKVGYIAGSEAER